MKYRHIHILAALFLIVGMAMQFVMAYRQVMRHQQENMDLKMQIAHEKMLFELYDAYEVVDQMEDYVLENLAQPDEILKCTRDVQEHYPSCFCLHVDFPENYFPKKGRWYSLFSYRQNDSIRSEVKSGDAFDYSQREWYQGALKSGSKGYWGKPYWSDIVEKMLFTYSDNLVDKDGQLVCVVGMDFSVAWLQQLMEQFRPMEEAICVIYSSDGTVLTANHDVAERVEALNLDDGHWIVSRQKLNTIDIEMAIAVPKSHIWQGLLWRMSVPFVIFVLGILVVGALIRRMMRDQQENARLESDRKVMSHELQIANGIQMGILRHDFPQDETIAVHADLLPMREVGGDLYDFSRQGDTLWFIIGDVSGKGIPAAIFMSATVNLFRSALGHQTSPKAIMEEMNAVLSDHNPSVTFVTAFIGHLHIPSGRLLFCNAAHMPLVVQGADGSVRSITIKPNIPLGFNGTYQFEEESCQLGPDETLVLYTDGVTEARDRTQQMMGMERWMDMVAHDADLLEAVKRYIGTAEPTDDITLMTISRKSGVRAQTND